MCGIAEPATGDRGWPFLTGRFPGAFAGTGSTGSDIIATGSTVTTGMTVTGIGAGGSALNGNTDGSTIGGTGTNGEVTAMATGMAIDGCCR